MVFSSYLFVFYFLPLAIGVYYVMPRRGKHLALALLSYLFYGWTNPSFIFLIFASTLVDYVCGRVMAGSSGGLITGRERTGTQKRALIVSIVTNLGLLAYFKYFNFGMESWNSLLGAMGMEGNDNFLRITLPLGISFYTFQSMSYSIDVYRGRGRAITNFVDFACYVAMFPQLVAGPIVRFHEIDRQLSERTHTSEKFARGVAFFCVGLAKKVLIADGCGKIADAAFDAASVHVLDAWYGLAAYSFQIYFDFSAYTDMAIGLGLMFGFVFPKNFDSPYRAQSITEFWSRWHLSLSHWLRDYLYVPLGGNRKGPSRTYVNLMLVMLLGGLWHGAAWNFVIWGAIHGGFLILERTQGKQSVYHKLPGPVRVAITCVVVMIAWVFFRAATWVDATNYLGCLFGLVDVDPGAALISGLVYQPIYWMTMMVAAVVVWFAPQTWEWTRRITPAKAALCLMLLAVTLVLVITRSYSPFIYFIF